MKKNVIIAILMVSVLCAGCGRIDDNTFVQEEENIAVSEELLNNENDKKILSIDFTGDGMNVDGQIISLPIALDELTTLWGEPRITAYEDEFGKRYNYTWDEFGIYCYAAEEEWVHTIGVMVNNTMDLEYFPEKLFEGNMTIEGENWYEVLPKGENMEFFRKYVMGAHSVVGEYTDIFAPETTGTAADYVGIEVSRETTTDMTFEVMAPTEKITLENQNGVVSDFDVDVLEAYLQDMFVDSNQFVTLTLPEAKNGIRYMQACQVQNGVTVQLGIEENGQIKLVEKVASQEECLEIFKTFYETGYVYQQEEYKPVVMFVQ